MQSVVGHLRQSRAVARHNGIEIEHAHGIFAAKLRQRPIRRIDARRFRDIGDMRHEREDRSRRARQRVEQPAKVLRNGEGRSAGSQKIVEAAVDDVAELRAQRRIAHLRRHIRKTRAAAREIERRKRSYGEAAKRAASRETVARDDELGEPPSQIRVSFHHPLGPNDAAAVGDVDALAFEARRVKLWQMARLPIFFCDPCIIRFLL